MPIMRLPDDFRCGRSINEILRIRQVYWRYLFEYPIFSLNFQSNQDFESGKHPQMFGWLPPSRRFKTNRNRTCFWLSTYPKFPKGYIKVKRCCKKHAKNCLKHRLPFGGRIRRFTRPTRFCGNSFGRGDDPNHQKLTQWASVLGCFR